MTAVDTNVFVGAIQIFDQGLRLTARESLKLLHRRGERLACFPQNLVEFWNVSTRPASANGLGFTPEQAARHVDRIQALFLILPETPDLFPAWRKIVFHHRVSGTRVHDARIAAAMEVYQVRRILTFDTNDFKRYTQLIVIDPRSV